MASCVKCSHKFDLQNGRERIISISGSITGDECTETYYYCENCGVYTIEVFWELFSGQESVCLRGPIDKADGDRKITLVRECSEPWNKKCRCPAHLKYFEGSLD